MEKGSRKNRDILIALILVGVVLIAVLVFFFSRHFFEKYLVYEDKMYGISISHPSDWSEAFEHEVIKENQVINLIAFRTPNAKPGDIDKFFNVIAYRVPQGLSLKSNVEQEIADMRNFYHGFKLLETSDTTLGGRPATRLVYTFVQNGVEYKKLQVHVLKDREGYALGYLQETKDFGWYTRQVEKMIGSFRFTRP